jgi:hypothetical protein
MNSWLLDSQTLGLPQYGRMGVFLCLVGSLARIELQWVHLVV